MRRKNIGHRFIGQVGARIKMLRFERGLSLRALAKLAACSTDSILNIEHGRTTITLPLLKKLARALKVEPFDLLNHNTQTDDLGYVVEKMRHDPNVLRLVQDQLERMQLPAALRSSSSVPASC